MQDTSLLSGLCRNLSDVLLLIDKIFADHHFLRLKVCIPFFITTPLTSRGRCTGCWVRDRGKTIKFYLSINLFPEWSRQWTTLSRSQFRRSIKLLVLKNYFSTRNKNERKNKYYFSFTSQHTYCKTSTLRKKYYYKKLRLLTQKITAAI